MAAIERKISFLVRNLSELGRCETFDLVTRFTLAVIRPLRELSGMRILMAIYTERMSGLVAKMAVRMALLTRNLAMLAVQGEIRQVMIERTAGNVLPTLRVVALHAILAEAAAMRILMTRRAIVELETVEFCECCNRFVAHLLTRPNFRMAFATRNGLMPAGEAKPGAIVRELGRRFPSLLAVAFLAGSAELATMLVCMARRARRGKT